MTFLPEESTLAPAMQISLLDEAPTYPSTKPAEGVSIAVKFTVVVVPVGVIKSVDDTG